MAELLVAIYSEDNLFVALFNGKWFGVGKGMKGMGNNY